MSNIDVTIQLLKGGSFHLNVPKNYSIALLKEIIEKEWNISTEDQILLYYGKIVPNDVRLEDFYTRCCLTLITRNLRLL